MVRFIITVANEPASRFKLLYQATAWAITGLSLWIGAGYAVGGQRAINSSSLGLISGALPGGLHMHGYILCGLGLLLASGLPDFRPRTRFALIGILFYAVLCAILIGANFVFVPISWAEPAWYSFLAFLAGVLVVLAPPVPVTHSGRRSLGRRNRQRINRGGNAEVRPPGGDKVAA